MSPATLRRFHSLCLSGCLVLAALPARGEKHIAPRGGTLLELGDEFAQIEFILDLQQGNLTAYILDGEAENPVRIRQSSIDIVVDQASYAGSRSATFTLHLKAVADVLTAETVGDTSEFMVHAGSLYGVSSLKGKIKRITIKSRSFQNLPFSIPAGEATQH